MLNFDPDYKFMEQRISQIRLMNIPPMGKASSLRGKFVGEGGEGEGDELIWFSFVIDVVHL